MIGLLVRRWRVLWEEGRADHDARQREHHGEDHQRDRGGSPGPEATAEPEQEGNRCCESQQAKDRSSQRPAENREPDQQSDMVEDVGRQAADNSDRSRRQIANRTALGDGDRGKLWMEIISWGRGRIIYRYPLVVYLAPS